MRSLLRLCTDRLATDVLYAEVKERVAEMNGYLDADSLRRQANTVVRLTVVTILGLIGTVTTGFLGMNLLAEADASSARKLLIFGVTFVGTTALTFYTLARSTDLSTFLEAISDKRLSLWSKLKRFPAIWRRDRD